MITEKILVVDDEETVCKSVSKILSRRGYTVEDALSADEAVKKINETAFDLVITDLMMPTTGGMELLTIIRDHYPELNVVMITGYASIESAVEATKRGAAGYLPKPFTPDELMTVARKALEERKSKTGETKGVVTGKRDDVIDVDMPFSPEEVEKSTSPEYVEALTHSDVPLAKKISDRAYCNTGRRMCARVVKEKRECPGECLLEKKEKARAAKAVGRTGGVVRDPIDVDLPFSRAEVEQFTGSDYVDSLDRSDMPRAALYAGRSKAKHTVLVIDDEPIVCHSVRRILSRRSCAVEEAFDVDLALQKMKIAKYDLVLLDLKMPKHSGMEVLRSIRRQYPDLPVIMISGYATIDHAVEATRLGANDFIPKPFTPDELLQATEEVLAA